MNFNEATAFFMKHRIGNETAEETHERIRNEAHSLAFHDLNVAAITAIRRNARTETSGMDFGSFLNEFAFSKRKRSPTEDLAATPSEGRGFMHPLLETKDERNKRLQRERQQRYQEKKTIEALEKEKETKREYMRRSRAGETAEERAARLETVSASMSQRRADETAEERAARLETVSASMSQRRADETAEERAARLGTVSASMSQRRADETAEERAARLGTVSASMSQRRADETAEERAARLGTVSASMSQIRIFVATTIRNEVQEMAYRANFDENVVVPHYCGPMNVKCQFCGSYNFKDAMPADGKFKKCCQKGQLIIPKPVINNVPQKYPEFLRRLLSDPQHPHYRNFRDHIRSYNSSVSFASFGAKLMNVPGNGPYVFKVQGQPYHLTSHTEPRNENERSYAQLYVIDSLTQATNTRMQHPAMSDCIPSILRDIHQFFRNNNSIARSYQLMHEVQVQQARLAAAQNLNVPVVHMAMKTDRQADERRFNLPTANEVAMVFVNEDGEPPFHRDIRVYPRNPNQGQPLFRLNIRNSNLDPMVYAILFPYGEPGWHPEYRCNGKHFSMLQFKSALMAIRDEFSPIMSAGKLTQQWIVDSYLQVEAHNLEYIRMNQSKLRAELYQGLADYVQRRAAEAGETAGRPVILPSTFQGSPRNMRERLQDAMAIFGKFGAPDLFVTFTANPKWREIEENLRPGETASDRPDLVDDVFHIKLDALIKDITVHQIFGKKVAYVFTIEFQKRGLPHAHILIVLAESDKFRSAERIDEVVCAEIPDVLTEPILHEIVVRQMLHGPCGSAKPSAVCMGDDGQCSKKFPKDFQEVTEVNSKGTGYPSYQRRMGSYVFKHGIVFDNRHVVPYNRFLLLKYNAHINVEVCTSLKGVKYIYKYIYKGFDCANCKIGHVDGQQVFIHDEISNFINARYVSAPEAYWRLSTFKMHDRSHAVIPLPVHLPRQNVVYFEDGREEEAVAAARNGVSKLTEWFTLNAMDATARTVLYPDIPYHYVFRNNMWNKRERGGDKVFGRMYGVSPRDEERFCLRLLLLHIPGATSFEYIRTFNGVQYGTFKEAASARNLLASDEEFDKFLSEAAHSQMPYQLRQSFAHLCIFCRPQNARVLFDKYVADFILDFERQYNRDAAINLALHQIESVFKDHGMICSDFGLPTPTGTYTEALQYDQTVEKDKADRLIPTLTVEQRTAFDKIVHAIDNPSSQQLFYLNGPGGSGKTYLYQTLISFVRGRGQTVNAYASTGIAATLMDDATTIHSGFGLPVPLLDTSVSRITSTSDIGKKLRNASLLILDEITMLNKHGLRVIDKLLREEIMKNNKPFGGKTLVISGDFRQTLPIVLRGNRVDIIEASILRTALWKKFENISLSQNMRSAGQMIHNEWLLQLGSGDTPTIEGLSDNYVEIPADMITGNNIIEKTFGDDITNLSEDELSKRIILTSTNSVALQINQQIMEKLNGQLVTYTSADEIISEGDDRTSELFPVEFVNEQTPSGVPPHKLSLKVGAVVMLIRNLNKRKGLCNGTRLIVRRLHEHYIVAEILSTNHRGDVVFLTRLDITPSESTLPFKMKRRQFPIIPAFAITINKSQGQSFETVGIHLLEPVFGHGQLYVALSRCKDPKKIKIYIQEGPKQGQLLRDGRYFTQNVVYKEIFTMTVR